MNTERLMQPEHPGGRKTRRKTRWPLKTTPPRCAACKREPPACICKESSHA